MRVPMPRVLRPLTDLIAGFRFSLGLFGGLGFVWVAVYFGTYLRWPGASGDSLWDRFPGGVPLAIATLLALPAMVGKLAGDLDRELAWRSVAALLPGRQRRFARAYWSLAVGSILLIAVVFQIGWSLVGSNLAQDLNGGPSWIAVGSLAALGFVIGLWKRDGMGWWHGSLWQLPALCFLGYTAQPILMLATRKPWFAALVWLVSCACFLLRTRPRPTHMEDFDRGPTSLALVAGEAPEIDKTELPLGSQEMPPEKMGGTLRGWNQAQSYVLRTTTSGIGSWKFATLAAGLCVGFVFLYCLSCWTWGSDETLRTEFVQSLLGSPRQVGGQSMGFRTLNMLIVSGLTMFYAGIASMPLLGYCHAPISRRQRASLVFCTTVQLALRSSTAMALVGCGVAYGAGSLGEAVPVATFPLVLQFALLLFAASPLFVAVFLKGQASRATLANPTVLVLYLFAIMFVFKGAAWNLEKSNLLDLSVGQQMATYIVALCISYGTFYGFTRHHFRHANLAP